MHACLSSLSWACSLDMIYFRQDKSISFGLAGRGCDIVLVDGREAYSDMQDRPFPNPGARKWVPNVSMNQWCGSPGSRPQFPLPYLRNFWDPAYFPHRNEGGKLSALECATHLYLSDGHTNCHYSHTWRRGGHCRRRGGSHQPRIYCLWAISNEIQGGKQNHPSREPRTILYALVF